MNAEQWLAGYQHRVGEIEQRAERARARLATVSDTATSSDGAVRLTVNPAGALQEIILGPPAEEMSRTQLAAAILGTAQHAQAAAAQQAAEVMRPLLGEGSPAMVFLRSQLLTPSSDGDPR